MAKIKVEVIAFEGLDITLIEEYLDGIINGATGLSEPLTDTFHLDRDIDSLVQSAIVSSTNLHLETADSVVAYVQLDEKWFHCGFSNLHSVYHEEELPGLMITITA